MPYYDSIAQQWHRATGYQGGPFKKHTLNELLLGQIGSLQDRSVLEVGAGNGYFMAQALERFSGQAPARLVISDISAALLDIAEKQLHVPGAEYLPLDVRGQFPFAGGSFDLVLATMVFNELTHAGAKRALAQIRRVLRQDGLFLLTVTHPGFIHNLDKRGVLRRDRMGLWTMPGANGLRLPVVRRSRQKYEQLLADAGFDFQALDVFAGERVLREKSGLVAGRTIPLALLFRCRKAAGGREQAEILPHRD
jgi:SAM-dependent methyltransferase